MEKNVTNKMSEFGKTTIRKTAKVERNLIATILKVIVDIIAAGMAYAGLLVFNNLLNKGNENSRLPKFIRVIGSMVLSAFVGYSIGEKADEIRYEIKNEIDRNIADHEQEDSKESADEDDFWNAPWEE